MRKINQKLFYRSGGKKCNLLIPATMLNELEELIYWYKGMGTLLSVLLEKFSTCKTKYVTKNNNSSTVNYQEDGLNLIRIHFRPQDSDWVELKLFAAAHNMSMCAFFSMLLMLEFAGLLESKNEFGVVPPFPKNLSFYQSITRYSTPKWTRILHLRI